MVILLLLPLLSVLLLLLNPLLLLIFHWVKINLQKFQFWAMVTSGAAWIISLVAFLIGPEVHLHPSGEEISGLLPAPALVLDGVSSALIMAVAAVVFYETLKGVNSPQRIARITGLGGICSAGLLSDSAYTLLYAWTALEAVCLLCSILDQDSRQYLRRKYLAVILRLFTPLVLIYAVLREGGEGAGLYFSDLPPDAGALVVLAGLAGLVGWVGFRRTGSPGKGEAQGALYAELLPGVLGLALMVRGAGVGAPALLLTPLYLLAVLALLGAAAGLLIARPVPGWIIVAMALMTGSAWSGLPGETLIWGLIYLLPGLLLRDGFSDRLEGILALIAGVAGVFCLPFFPAWGGTGLFGGGLAGAAFAGAYGLAGGGLLADLLERIKASEGLSSALAPTRITAVVALLISLCASAYNAGLLRSSLALLSAPLACWLSLPLMILLALLGPKVPRFRTSLPGNTLSKTGDIFVNALDAAAGFIDGIVTLLTGLFEGEGGLIWALVIGFLIISLISLQGG
jgi:hypothetical protein